MREKLKEQLSALVDDEISAEEVKLLTRQLTRSEDLCAQVERYFLIKNVVRHGRMPVGADRRELATRLAEALDSEPALSASRAGGWFGPVLRPLAGTAVAGAVAMAAIMLWPRTGSDPSGSMPVSNQIAATIPAMETSDGVQTGTRLVSDTQQDTDQRQWERLDPRVRQRLNGYLINHSEHSVTGQLGGVLTYVRIAGHEGGE